MRFRVEHRWNSHLLLQIPLGIELGFSELCPPSLYRQYEESGFLQTAPQQMMKVISARQCKRPEYHKKVMSSVRVTEWLERPCFQAEKEKVSSHLIVEVAILCKSKSIVAPISASISSFSRILLIKKCSEWRLTVYNKRDFSFLLMMV